MIFHVQDPDRPMYVIAEDWNEALKKWRECIKAENDHTAEDDEPEPQGIALIAEDNDIIP